MAPSRLIPLPAVTVAGTRFLVDVSRPVAMLDDGVTQRFVTWPDAPMPLTAASASLIEGPDAVWVVYDESPSADLPTPRSSTAVRIGVDGRADGIVLGPLSAIGADARGIWLSTSPTPSPERMPGDQHEDW